MSETFVPDTIEGVSQLLVSREWDKAAVVWAYVHVADGPGGDMSILKNENAKTYTPTSFAAKGFVGLRSSNSVQMHWQRWQDAIDSGHAVPIKPGDPIPKVDLPWKEKTTAPKSDKPAKPKNKPRLVNDPAIRDAVESLPGKSATEIKEELSAQGIVNPATGKPPSVDTINDVMRAVQAERDAAPIAWDSIPGNQQAKLANAKERIRRELEREYTDKVVQETLRLKAEAGKAVEDYKAMLLADAVKERATRDAERERYKIGLAAIRAKGLISMADYKLIKACLHPDDAFGVEKRAQAFRLFSDPRIEALLVKGEGR